MLALFMSPVYFVCERSCRVYTIPNRTCVHNITKFTPPSPSKPSQSSPSTALNNNPLVTTSSKSKALRMFHDDTMKSFFRRLAFSPDGQLLVVPSGCLEQGATTFSGSSSSGAGSSSGEQNVYTTFVFSRHIINK